MSRVVTDESSNGLVKPSPWISQISSAGPVGVQLSLRSVLAPPGVMQANTRSTLLTSVSAPSGKREMPLLSCPEEPESSRPDPEPSVKPVVSPS